MHNLAAADLNLFVRVATLCSLSAVARERNVPVSQISRTLVRIEKACGTRLVNRTTHALTLTPEGEIFLEHCVQICNYFETLEGEFANHTHAVRGLVRVAASTVIVQYALVPNLPALAQKYPDLQVDLLIGDELVDLARQGVDIAIRSGQRMPDHTVARRIGSLSRALYAAPSYLKHAGEPTHPQELSEHWLIANTAAPNLNQWPFVVQGQPYSYAVHGRWSSNSTGLTTALALTGLGIAQLARLVAEPLVQQGLLAPVLSAYTPRQEQPLYAITIGGRHRLPKVRACIEHWCACLQASSAPQQLPPVA